MPGRQSDDLPAFSPLSISIKPRLLGGDVSVRLHFSLRDPTARRFSPELTRRSISAPLRLSPSRQETRLCRRRAFLPSFSSSLMATASVTTPSHWPMIAPPTGKPFGLQRRIPWNDSRVVGSPDPPLPYKVVRAFPRLTIKQPLTPDPRAGDQSPVHPPAPQFLGRARPSARRPATTRTPTRPRSCSRSTASPSAWPSIPTTSATATSTSA